MNKLLQDADTLSHQKLLSYIALHSMRSPFPHILTFIQGQGAHYLTS